MSKAKSKRPLAESTLRNLTTVRLKDEKARRYERQLQRLRERLDGIAAGESAIDILSQDRQRS